MGFLGLIWLRWAKFFWVCKGGDGSVFLVVTTKIGYGTFFVFWLKLFYVILMSCILKIKYGMLSVL